MRKETSQPACQRTSQQASKQAPATTLPANRQNQSIELPSQPPTSTLLGCLQPTYDDFRRSGEGGEGRWDDGGGGGLGQGIDKNPKHLRFEVSKSQLVEKKHSKCTLADVFEQYTKVERENHQQTTTSNPQSGFS